MLRYMIIATINYTVTRLLGQIKFGAGWLNQELQPEVKVAIYVDYIGDNRIAEILSNRLPSMPDK